MGTASERTVTSLTAQPKPVITAATDLHSWNLVPFLVSERKSGRILHGNRTACELLGFEPDSLADRTVVDLGLWPSLPERDLILSGQPGSPPAVSRLLKTASGGDLSVIHGWQVASLGDSEIVTDVFVDMSTPTRVHERLERLDRFRSVLSRVLRESLDRGLDEGFYHRVLENAVATIPGAQTASLLVRAEDGNYHYQASVACDLDTLRQVSFTPEQMVLGQNGQPVLHYGYSANAELPQEMRATINASGPTADIKVSIVTPVILDGETVAVFNLDNLEDAAAFDEDALTMALDYAQHLAVLLQRFRLEEALWQQANMDKLTGLPNRRRFDELLDAALTSSDDTGLPVALLFIDMDQFKAVNDAYGHSFGDLLVRAVAQRLAALMPAGSTLSRWGGDELVAIVSAAGNEQQLENLARRIVDSGKEPYLLDGVEVHLTLSIGIACYPGYGTNAQELLRYADTALYTVKKSGRNGFRVFDNVLNERMQLQMDLRSAITDEQIELHYQPRFDVAGRLTTMEALARWQHPERGLLIASKFIPIAEEAGLMPRLGLRLLDMACSQARSWLDAGLHAPIAFNISRSQLASPLMAEQVEATLSRHALPAHLLELQISETSAVKDVSDSVLKLLRLRQRGVRLLLDDISSGFSSLAILRRFHLDGIKIGRELIAQLMGALMGSELQQGADEVIHALISLGRDLGTEVIAEGVETAQQHEFLIAAGATQFQGFLLSDALPVDQATRLLTEQDSAR